MEDNNSKTRGIRPKQQINGLPCHSSLPFRAFSRPCPPAMLARKSNFKIPLFIPSIFPMRWLLAYVEGQDSSVCGKGIKAMRGRDGTAGRWRKVSWTRSLELQLFTLLLVNNRCTS